MERSTTFSHGFSNRQNKQRKPGLIPIRAWRWWRHRLSLLGPVARSRPCAGVAGKKYDKKRMQETCMNALRGKFRKLLMVAAVAVAPVLAPVLMPTTAHAAVV